ncbi:hypothetical protein FHS18_004538 [Paenibacillus phyllosphaerae]|uniref:Uncharacterized protein n=1 Tax=Paenibacillus phyllosphaerae TaxID=274593 RepID=A0A7W5FPQ1_9BACL|nr:hypothetical protein [Paenibacillus phyllosphaerae]MBB3112437.1 hypothetical protein [Paenibacillus phyllosphaerae]
MFTLKEKIYLLKLLKKESRWAFLRLRRKPPEHAALIGKLEQMIRNEQVNRQHL